MTYKTWEEMSPLEQAHATWWDMYKYAHGIRPRSIATSTWTLEDFEHELENLHHIIVMNDEIQMQAEARAVEKFEENITNLLRPDRNREQVIRALMKLDDTDDPEYFCYLRGLPYGYITLEQHHV